MKSDKISRSFELTVNLGNYESARFGYSVERDGDPKEMMKECIEQVSMEARRFLGLHFESMKNDKVRLIEKMEQRKEDYILGFTDEVPSDDEPHEKLVNYVPKKKI